MLSQVAFKPNLLSALIRQSRFPQMSLRLASTEVAKPAAIVEHVAQLNENKERFLKLLQEELPRPYDGPERDHVNFPRRVRLVDPGVLRHGFIPQEWLDFFYKKTGVTGPYFFGFGLTTFLFSKELYVIEEETSTGVALFLLFYIIFKKFGPMGREYSRKLRNEHRNEALKKIADEKQMYADALANAEKERWHAGAASMLITAKKENIQIQLESEYRRRSMDVYNQVKKRLEYFLEFDATKRKLEQKHMVDWIVGNVVTSITPQQEKEALQKCVADLKLLSAHSA